MVSMSVTAPPLNFGPPQETNILSSHFLNFQDLPKMGGDTMKCMYFIQLTTSGTGPVTSTENLKS